MIIAAGVQRGGRGPGVGVGIVNLRAGAWAAKRCASAADEDPTVGETGGGVKIAAGVQRASR